MTLIRNTQATRGKQLDIDMTTNSKGSRRSEVDAELLADYLA
jgi:hypothetical protein